MLNRLSTRPQGIGKKAGRGARYRCCYWGRDITVKSMKGGKVLGENEIKACRQDSGEWYITKQEAC